MLAIDARETIIRLLMALIAGGILGYERSLKRIDAGFRTYIIVCMSSCAIMLTNLHLFERLQVGDPTRMPAQVISGVGFLGAGCILVTKQHRIKGVTTAAGVWAAACLGLCIGAGDYLVSGIVLVISILTMTVFRVVDDMVITKTKHIRVFVQFDSISDVTGLLKSSGMMESRSKMLNFWTPRGRTPP